MRICPSLKFVTRHSQEATSNDSMLVLLCEGARVEPAAAATRGAKGPGRPAGLQQERGAARLGAGKRTCSLWAAGGEGGEKMSLRVSGAPVEKSAGSRAMTIRILADAGVARQTLCSTLCPLFLPLSSWMVQSGNGRGASASTHTHTHTHAAGGGHSQSNSLGPRGGALHGPGRAGEGGARM